MVGETPGENPYAAPAVEILEPKAERSLHKPITALLFFYHFLVACFSLFAFWMIIGVLLTLFIPPKFLNSVNATSVQGFATIILFLPAQRYLRRLMASRRRFDE